MLIACRNIYVFTDIFTSPQEKIPGSKSWSFKNLLPPGTTGTPESLQSATAQTLHHGYSTIKATSGKSATTIPE